MYLSGAAVVAFNEGISIHPEIVIPSLFTEREVDYIKPVIDATASAVFTEAGEN